MERPYCIVEPSEVDSTFLSKILGDQDSYISLNDGALRVYEAENPEDPYFLSKRMVTTERMLAMTKKPDEQVVASVSIFSKIKDLIWS